MKSPYVNLYYFFAKGNPILCKSKVILMMQLTVCHASDAIKPASCVNVSHFIVKVFFFFTQHNYIMKSGPGLGISK